MRYHEFIGVFEDSDEDIIGNPSKSDLPVTINLDAVEAFNDAKEGRTCVRLNTGDDLLLRINYSEFKKLYFYSTTPVN